VVEQLLQLSEAEFEQIEEAIALTAKGRSFLRRFQRRAMGAATEEIRGMLQEFRGSWRLHAEGEEASKHVGVLRRELMEMAASIERARREVAALRPPDGNSNKIITATSELDAIVISTERASFEILNAAERLLELTGRLRQENADPEICALIDSEVSNIFTACSFQDLTGQRTSKVVNALRYIEQRINAMIGIWGEDRSGGGGAAVADDFVDTRPDAHLLNGPQLDGLGVSQADVDSMFDSPAAPSPAPGKALQNQADIDSMFDSPAPPAPPPPAPASPAPASPAAAKAGQSQSQSDIDSMFDSPAPAKAPAPAPAKASQSQSDIDSMFDSPAPAKAPAPAPAPAKVSQSQSDIDSMFDSPAPAPAPAKASQSQSDIDSMFESAPAAPAVRPADKPKAAEKPKPAPKAEAPAAKPALDQSAIDALFG
jgi:chemotaxis regulatin CheY-phosphate phosphatase CheZ